jgi:M6 family metalloprotease-like protein
MRKISLICLLAFLLMPLSGHAQREFTLLHGDCLPDSSDEVASDHRAGRMNLPTPKTNWNPDKTYRQLVILVEFADLSFSYASDAHTFYNKMFNESGYNDDKGPGCVADYYRDQSNGMLNLQFDVYGPVKVSSSSQPYANPTKDTKNYGRDAFIEATKKVIADNPGIDFSVYDWNGDKYIEQVVYVYAGVPGNMNSTKAFGHIWPNTSTFSTITTPDGYKIVNYTASGELWPTSTPRSCGIGTICHEFTHSLGLPDIYPTNDSGYSVCDEWDLMDGGNFTNFGWCPPNFTPMEKYLLGWLSFTDLEEPATITDLKPVGEGGDVYRIMHSASEWLLLENRQQRGWDSGAPGKGLVIYHVNYDGSVWRGNTVNNNANARRFELVHADNMDFDAWTDYMDKNRLGTYAVSPRMQNRHLSTSPYPWTTDSTDFVNNELTETSVPSPKMNYPNEEGKSLLNKPITNIQMSEDGLISFDFMGGDKTGIGLAKTQTDTCEPQTYDVSGRRLSSPRGVGFFIQRRADGTIRKCSNKLYIY